METTIITAIAIVLLVALTFTYNAYREVKRENKNLKK